MERIAVLSDVHGNITALNAVLDDSRKRGISNIYCLGDSVTTVSYTHLPIFLFFVF